MKALILAFLFCVLNLHAQELDLTAANSTFDFVDQTNGIGNSCGPACLLNSFGSGTEHWQSCFAKIPGTNDRARIASVIKSWGQEPSVNIPNRKRWEIRGGVNFNDLSLMALEMSKLNWSLAQPKSELFFTGSPAESQKMLKRAHKRLKKSFKKGFPATLSVRRFVLRDNQWQSVQGHFVVITAMPSQLPRNSSSFPISFIDPHGAKKIDAQVTLGQGNFPCLTLLAPKSNIGTTSVKPGETTALGLAGAIGVW